MYLLRGTRAFRGCVFRCSLGVSEGISVCGFSSFPTVPLAPWHSVCVMTLRWQGRCGGMGAASVAASELRPCSVSASPASRPAFLSFPSKHFVLWLRLLWVSGRCQCS